MLSSRGSMSTATLLSEVVESQPSTLGRRVLRHTDAQAIWASLCRVLRHQLLQANNIVLPHKTMGFFFKRKEVVRDGETKYYARTSHCGFHDAFVTRFSLAPGTVPRLEGAREDFVKLPMDYVAQDCGFNADYVTTFLNEVFLAIGEALFRGRLLQLDFEGVAGILIKKEKAAWTFDTKFREDVYAIDSRKWPIAVKEVGLGILSAAPRPVSSSGRPSSARSNSSSRPSSARPRSSSSNRPASSQSQAQGESENPRPAFVSAAVTGKTFEELLKMKPRAAPKQRPQSGRKPLKVMPQQQQEEQENSTSLVPSTAPTPRVLGHLDENEEESIYSVLSPARHSDPMATNTMMPSELQHQQTSISVPAQHFSEEDQDEECIYTQSQPRPWQNTTIRPTNMDPRQLGLAPASAQGRPNSGASSVQGRVPTPTTFEQAQQQPSTGVKWEEDLGEDGDSSKHVHWSSPTLPPRATPLAAQGQANFFAGGSGPERPTSGRKRFNNATASLAHVKALLQDGSQ